MHDRLRGNTTWCTAHKLCFFYLDVLVLFHKPFTIGIGHEGIDQIFSVQVGAELIRLLWGRTTTKTKHKTGVYQN